MSLRSPKLIVPPLARMDAVSAMRLSACNSNVPPVMVRLLEMASPVPAARRSVPAERVMPLLKVLPPVRTSVPLPVLATLMVRLASRSSSSVTWVVPEPVKTALAVNVPESQYGCNCLNVSVPVELLVYVVVPARGRRVTSKVWLLATPALTVTPPPVAMPIWLSPEPRLTA